LAHAELNRRRRSLNRQWRSSVAGGAMPARDVWLESTMEELLCRCWSSRVQPARLHYSTTRREEQLGRRSGGGENQSCAATPLLPLLRLVGRGSKGGAAVGRCPTEEVQGRGRSPVEKEQGRGPVPGGASSATILAPWQIGL
jgi:hypothetical protein